MRGGVGGGTWISHLAQWELRVCLWSLWRGQPSQSDPLCECARVMNLFISTEACEWRDGRDVDPGAERWQVIVACWHVTSPEGEFAQLTRRKSALSEFLQGGDVCSGLEKSLDMDEEPLRVLMDCSDFTDLHSFYTVKTASCIHPVFLVYSAA